MQTPLPLFWGSGKPGKLPKISVQHLCFLSPIPHRLRNKNMAGGTESCLEYPQVCGLHSQDLGEKKEREQKTGKEREKESRRWPWKGSIKWSQQCYVWWRIPVSPSSLGRLRQKDPGFEASLHCYITRFCLKQKWSEWKCLLVPTTIWKLPHPKCHTP